MLGQGFQIPRQELASFCQRHHIRRLALFGSVLRDDFGPDSDVDVLVEFDPAARVGLFRLMNIQSQLSKLLGRNVDLNTLGFLSDRFRDEVLREAEDQYVAA
ncbi:MAG: nucleotidyltransferase family protein [Planctomycetes bacterium]|nr:nucleotidyltransferase family protein [Planctomycetota bacterium]